MCPFHASLFFYDFEDLAWAESHCKCIIKIHSVGVFVQRFSSLDEWNLKQSLVTDGAEADVRVDPRRIYSCVVHMKRLAPCARRIFNPRSTYTTDLLD
jgi:hypothetical protein